MLVFLFLSISIISTVAWGYERVRNMLILEEIKIHLNYWDALDDDADTENIPKCMWHTVIADFRKQIERI